MAPCLGPPVASIQAARFLYDRTATGRLARKRLRDTRPRAREGATLEPPLPEPFPMPLDLHLFQLYLAAAVVLVLLPGPDSLLVLGNSLFEGRRAGWITAAGTLTGNLVHAALAAAVIHPARRPSNRLLPRTRSESGPGRRTSTTAAAR